MKKNFVIFLISILFLCITDKKLQSEDIISLIGVWKGVNKSYSTEKGYRTWGKKIKIFDAARKELPEKICNLSKEGDQLMIEVERIWLSAYASLLGDVALQELCFGGLWISGGTASKHFKNFKSDLFLKSLTAYIRRFADLPCFNEINGCFIQRILIFWHLRF